MSDSRSVISDERFERLLAESIDQVPLVGKAKFRGDVCTKHEREPGILESDSARGIRGSEDSTMSDSRLVISD
jgi:hypothetical protein